MRSSKNFSQLWTFSFCVSCITWLIEKNPVKPERLCSLTPKKGESLFSEKEEQRHERALIFCIKNRSKRYGACSDAVVRVVLQNLCPSAGINKKIRPNVWGANRVQHHAGGGVEGS